jgi:phosphopantothenoylcysteine decarboxylase/phosphopantothenate--cysteine ligase
MLEAVELCEDLVAFFQPKSLLGQRVLVTAGPTFEPIDPVRGITNLSSGKMGFAIARAAQEAGARVTLVAGPVHLPTPRGVRRIDVRTAQEMHDAGAARRARARRVRGHGRRGRLAAAPLSEQKIKNDGAKAAPVFELTENPDILAAVAAVAAAVTASASPPRATTCCARARKARAQERAAHRRQPGSRHLRPRRQCAPARGFPRAPRAAAADKLTLARQLRGRIASRLPSTDVRMTTIDSRSARPQNGRADAAPTPPRAAPAWTCVPAWTRRCGSSRGRRSSSPPAWPSTSPTRGWPR